MIFPLRLPSPHFDIFCQYCKFILTSAQSHSPIASVAVPRPAHSIPYLRSQNVHTLRLLDVLLSARRLRMSGRTNMRRMSAAGRTPPQTLFMKPPASKAQAGDPRSRADHRPFSFRRLCRSGTGAEDAYRVPERYLTGLPLPNTVSAGKCRNREMCRCYR